jgi:RNA-directed DNA polymerase
MAETFQSCQSLRDVAALLRISEDQLRYLLYIGKAKLYKVFTIPKKDGTRRRITAPEDGLLRAQRAVNALLQVSANPPDSCQGFTTGRSIVTNAFIHKNARYVFNVDLEDFFPSIHFGRILGLFRSKPFNCPPKCAIILARLCCYQGSIPQGAPTSPLLSNMICFGMDRELTALARDRGCRYSRYADDITFSSNLMQFPPDIAEFDVATKTWVPGGVLLKIISRHSFKIHNAKTRMMPQWRRQVVTGLRVNKKLNVPSRMLSNIRAIIHNVGEYGLANAEGNFHVIRDKRKKEGTSLQQVLRGKLNYVGMVLGTADPKFVRLARSANAVIPNLIDYCDLKTLDEKARDAVCVLTNEDKNQEAISQGTGFWLKGVGLVTCAHVVAKELHARYADQWWVESPVEVIDLDANLDVAVLKCSLTQRVSLDTYAQPLNWSDTYFLCGFPNYTQAQSVVIKQCKIVGEIRPFWNRRLLVDTVIARGASGGPLLDKNGRVVGIAVTGSAVADKPGAEDVSAVIPMSELESFFSRWKGQV